MNNAVKDLHNGLLDLDNPTYSSIDKLMRSLMKKYDLTAKELHYDFRDEHNDQTPDEWIKSQRTKKMKTFKEFLEEAYLVEMRKEDKVKGKKKTPMYLNLTSKKLEKTPEGGWKMKKTEYKRPNPDASIGRMRQGMTASPEDAPRNPGWGTERTTLRRQPHGSGGEQRGKKKVPGEKKERNWNTDGPSPQQKVEWKKAARANKGRDLLGYKRGY